MEVVGGGGYQLGGPAGRSHHDVAAAVQGEVVGPGEGAVTLSAAERFDSRVLAEVSGQLVGAGKAPGAALPGTVVGLLTCKGAGHEQRGQRGGKDGRLAGSQRFWMWFLSVIVFVTRPSHLCVSACALSGGSSWCKPFYSLHSRTCGSVSS